MDNSEKKFLTGDQLKAIISSLGEGLFLVNREYQVMLMNPKAEELLDLKTEGIIGRDIRNFVQVFRGDNYLPNNERPLEKMFAKGKAVSADLEDNFYYQSSSGKRFPAALVVTPFIQGSQTTGAVIVFRDITREKSLDEAKSHFLSIAAHQLRTPLTSIRWYTEILSSGDAGPLNKDQESFLNQIYRSTIRLISTIDLVLSLTRVEAGQVKLQTEKVNIQSLTEEILHELESSISEKNLKIKVDAPPLPDIQADALSLRMVANNLISNAVRYTNQNGAIEIQIKSSGEELFYSVKDNGIGIPRHQQSRIFEKFFRADNALVKIPDGDGLGLALAKRLTELWGGRIYFESEENKGSTFSFTIPLNQ